MSRSLKLGILYAAMALIIAIAGHLVFPGLDVLWLALGAFAVIAVPQAFLMERRRDDREQ
jgi:hypothetical protein